MGAFGGLLTFDGVVEERWLRTLGSRLARRGPDTELLALDGQAGLVYRAYGATEEDQQRSGLWRSTRGAWLVFDGRLDNGPELARTLGLSGREGTNDSAILLAGFERQGAGFVARIVGDFALAYWEPLTRALILARDVAAVRTLYYHRGARQFAFASDLGSLVDAVAIDREIDEEHVAAFLGSGGTDEDSTVYRHIRAVEPAHAITVSGEGRFSKRVYWSLPYDADLLRYKDPREYVEHAGHLIKEAVHVRLRTSRPVVAELSGGLDSSAIVCVATHLLRSGVAGTASLRTASRVLDASDTTDQKFRVAVEKQCGVEYFHQAESDVPLVMPPPDPTALHVVSLLSVTAGWETALSAYMRQAGSHTLLSGEGGDEMFCSRHVPEPGLADLLVRGRLGELHRAWRVWSEGLQQPYRTLAWLTVREALPRPWMPRFMTPQRWGRRVAAWVHPRLRDQALINVENMERRLRGYRRPSQRKHAAGYYDVVKQIARGARQEFDARHLTYPFLHRPLVEFLHVVPHNQKLRLGETRILMRRSLRDILPPELLTRRGKGLSNELFARNFTWNWLTDEAMVVRHGFVDQRLANLALQNPEPTKGLVPPLLATAVEAWLRSHGMTSAAERGPVSAVIEQMFFCGNGRTIEASRA